jgi:hypothetical protein
MPFCNDVPATVIPARTEGGPEYADLNYDPADELSGMAPWDPAYVAPDPPAADGTRYYPGLGPTGWRQPEPALAAPEQGGGGWDPHTPQVGADPNLPR